MQQESEKILFENRRGEKLAGRLELPAGTPAAYALFAHCFTCSKDIAAASRISRALAAQGIAVLRFDFTGLGGSDGDFANTNFSSNVEDLVAAAEHLRAHYRAPKLLIGHSLGGAAVLTAARRLPDVVAVSTIAAPSDPSHLRSILERQSEQIEREGAADVEIGGRTFSVQKQFLDDLDSHDLDEELGSLNKALLVFHSPVDNVVGIEHAQRIYQAARGFKSFVSLADADHLLSKKEDAEYVAAVLAAWASRYIESDAATAPEPERTHAGVLVEELGTPYKNRVVAGGHVLVADEPVSVGGRDEGPDPYAYLLASLGACTSMTLRMYADRKKWPLEKVAVRLQHSRVHAKDCESCEEDEGRADRFEREIELTGDALDDAQRARLLEIADRCPVHRTLTNQKEILTQLATPAPR